MLGLPCPLGKEIPHLRSEFFREIREPYGSQEQGPQQALQPAERMKHMSDEEKNDSEYEKPKSQDVGEDELGDVAGGAEGQNYWELIGKCMSGQRA